MPFLVGKAGKREKSISEIELAGLGNLAKKLISGKENRKMKSERGALEIKVFYQYTSAGGDGLKKIQVPPDSFLVNSNI